MLAFMYSKKWCNSVKLHTCKPPKPWKLANRMPRIRVFRFRFVDVMGSVVTQWSAFQLDVGKFLRCCDWEVAPHLVNEPLVLQLELLAGRFQCCGFFFYFPSPVLLGVLGMLPWLNLFRPNREKSNYSLHFTEERLSKRTSLGVGF